MHGDVWIVGGETYVWDSNAGMWTGQIPEIVISRNPYQSSSGYNFNTWTWSNMLTGQSGGFMLSSSGYMDLGPISGGGGGGTGTGNPPPTSNLFSMSAFIGYAGLLVKKMLLRLNLLPNKPKN
ncbi:hypothetical protein SMI01S_16290 [Sphingobacterium mizutaii NBRC 14946 = DSM 11724]|uniref:Uncharacterized protein n=3 Tax=Sphingobacterium mizutaii TaxID=1010 RepID=A0AAJ4X879_9SPHI|nr:hypothetical protein SMI01S_16290 [Sphingobacterium mizutaii NBRC 14946 = DSM 11724]SDL78175.1 hypothetical protein SAMN05192578_10953 [Sphingobacterium mizutaii]SNV37853.1 Uncharacterised protein [Sphingobacterium mizutaii]